MDQRSSDAAVPFSYLTQMHRAIDELATEICYDGEIYQIAAAIRLGQNAIALTELEKLKLDFNNVIAAICSLLHQYVNADQAKSDEILMLKCRVIEGARAYAALNEDVEGVALMDGHLDAMGSLVAASIANLGPDSR
jgi:hypothetical protein